MTKNSPINKCLAVREFAKVLSLFIVNRKYLTFSTGSKKQRKYLV